MNKLWIIIVLTSFGLSSRAQSIADNYFKTRQEHYARVKKRDLDGSLKGARDYTTYSAQFENALLRKAFELYKAQVKTDLDTASELRILKNRSGEFPRFLLCWNKTDTLFAILSSQQRQNKGGLEELKLVKFGTGFSRQELQELNRVLAMISNNTTEQFEAILEKPHTFTVTEPWFELHIYRKLNDGSYAAKNYGFGMLK